MRRRSQQAGFTIVEVMIVLAVTGALFVGIASTLAGRQRQAEFTQAINEVRSQIQQTISEVQEGYYASGNNFSCTASGTGPGSSITFASVAPGAKAQGTNGGCIFLGKALHFTTSDGYDIFPVAGLQSATNFMSSRPTAIYNTSGVDQSVSVKYKFGITVVAMKYAGASSASTIGVFSSFDDTNAQEGSNQQADIYGMPSAALTSNKATAAGQIKTDLDTVTASSLGSLTQNPNGGVQICFKSGGTDNYGLITVGQNNRQGAVELTITSQANCGI